MLSCVFNAYGSYKVDSVYQWDKDRILVISGIYLTAPEVHFTNSTMGRAIVRQATAGITSGKVQVAIPNSLLQQALPIKVYVYMRNTLTDAELTIETFTIPVIPRNKPEDYTLEISDDEVYSFTKFENLFNRVAYQDSVDAVNARIDNLVANNNPTEGNTELVDIRTDADGNVHTSAGQAIRTQFTTIKDIFNNTGIKLDSSLIAIDGFYIATTGIRWENTNYAITQPISVPTGYKVSFTARGYKTQVAMMSELNDDGTYTTLVASIDSEDNTYTYVTEKDTNIVFSYSKAGACDLKISLNVSALTTAIYNEISKSKAERIEEDYVSLSIFTKFGVIGDSYASGEIVRNDKLTDVYAMSWGQIMARNLGTICDNYSAGGMTTRSWLTSSKGLSLMNFCDIYYLALGINDANNLGEDYLGTIDDINDEDYTQNGDSFYGNYGRIISTIQNTYRSSKIVMFTIIPTTDMKARYNEAIINIANHFGIPYIVQTDDPFFTSDFYINGKEQSHPVGIVYSGMAKAFERLLKRCVRDNFEYFKDVCVTQNPSVYN